MAFHRHVANKYNRPMRSNDFRQALQELNGAFLTYHKGYARFINPSVRDFLGLIISSDPELILDVMAAAIHFQQVTQLWELSQARPDSAIWRMFRADTTQLVQALGRMLLGPEMHWEKRPDGRHCGTYIDMSNEGRIGFLAATGNILQSVELVALADKAADFLTGQWKNVTPGLARIVGILEDMPDEKWFFRNGGEAIYLKLIDSVMDELHFAWADDLVALLEFQRNAVGWTAADATRLSNAIARYRHSGASDDIDNCSTVSELSDLRKSLDRLHGEFGIDLSYDIERLDEKIAEREESGTDFRAGTTGGISSSHSSSLTISDDEIREMFHILRDKP